MTKLFISQKQADAIADALGVCRIPYELYIEIEDTANFIVGTDAARWKKDTIWMYNPYTLQEITPHMSDVELYYNQGFVKGRNPNKHHGGHIGEYTKERSLKKVATRKSNNVPAWNKGIKHTDATRNKISLKAQENKSIQKSKNNLSVNNLRASCMACKKETTLVSLTRWHLKCH